MLYLNGDRACDPCMQGTFCRSDSVLIKEYVIDQPTSSGCWRSTLALRALLSSLLERLREFQDFLESHSIEPDDYGVAYDDDGK